MNKQFNFILPDEPYKTTTALNKVVECTYTGPRYVLIQIDADDKQCRSIAGAATLDSPALDHSAYASDEFHYRVIDADQYTLECAYLTEEYHHGTVEDHAETLTDADGETFTFEHVYEDQTGILSHCYWAVSLLYDVEIESFSGPSYREHVNTRQSVIDTANMQAAEIDKALAEKTFSDADKAALEEYSTWLKSIETKYAGIDHWKIPFPNIANLPNYLAD